MNKLPVAFARRVKNLLGEESGAFFEALEKAPVVSIRFNPWKPVALEALPFEGVLQGRVPWCEHGVYLGERPAFTFDPLLHGGGYYVQEASSMFVERVLVQLLGDRPARVLDLCAAPGGKSTLGVSVLGEGGLWVANEVSRPRSAVLKENMVKWGDERVVVTRGDPSRFVLFPGAFDAVLVDAPCSGEGMFRKDAGAIDEWREGTGQACEERQRRIVRDAWECVAPGGYLVYSTCTFNPGENERVLEWARRQLGGEGVAITGDFPGIVTGDSPLPCYRFYPHRVRGEGFFVGVLQKTGEGRRWEPGRGKEREPRVVLSAVTRELAGETPGLALYLAGEMTGIFPRSHAAFARQLERVVGVSCKGRAVEERGRPAHALATWRGFPLARARAVEVDREVALGFLRGGETRVDVPAGEWAVVVYRSLVLGWVKGVGGRVNNYYPREWRVRARPGDQSSGE